MLFGWTSHAANDDPLERHDRLVRLAADALQEARNAHRDAPEEEKKNAAANLRDARVWFRAMVLEYQDAFLRQRPQYQEAFLAQQNSSK